MGQLKIGNTPRLAVLSHFNLNFGTRYQQVMMAQCVKLTFAVGRTCSLFTFSISTGALYRRKRISPAAESASQPLMLGLTRQHNTRPLHAGRELSSQTLKDKARQDKGRPFLRQFNQPAHSLTRPSCVPKLRSSLLMVLVLLCLLSQLCNGLVQPRDLRTRSARPGGENPGHVSTANSSSRAVSTIGGGTFDFGFNALGDQGGGIEEYGEASDRPERSNCRPTSPSSQDSYSCQGDNRTCVPQDLPVNITKL